MSPRPRPGRRLLAAPDRSLPPVAVTVTAWALVTVWLLPRPSNDMAVFLLPWFRHLVALGPVAAFAHPFSDYTPAYLYLLAALTPFHGLLPDMVLIKLVSLAGSVALALAVRRLLRSMNAAKPDRAAALVLLLPTALLNAGLLGQCDAIWAAAAVMAIAAALDRRHVAMLAWFGLALAFKLQALLLAPLIVGLLLQRRVPLSLWLIAPAVILATMLPAWLAGWPAADLATIWLREAGSYPLLSSRAPNVWTIVQDLLGHATAWRLDGLAAAAAIAAAVALAAWAAVRAQTGHALVETALLCVLLTAGLAPHMHERYFFLADILSLTIALATGERAAWRTALLIQSGSILALLAYRSAFEGAAALGAVPMLLATVLVARRVLANGGIGTARQMWMARP